MALLLVVNAGSTSLKLSLVDPDGRSERIESLDAAGSADVVAAGHRIVHGGPRLRGPVVVDESVERELASVAELAPLHNASALDALEEARRALPAVPHVAVFDTAFHATLDEAAAVYAVPRHWEREWGIRRYGFHGLSVQWAAGRSVPGGSSSATSVEVAR